MSLESRIADVLVSIATDYKQLRTWLSGSSSGDLTGLTTADKSSIVNAINEVKSGNSGAPPAASENAAGVVELATLTEVATGTDISRAVTAAGVRQERAALRDEILGGAGPMADTLQELYALVESGDDTVNSLLTTVSGKANSEDVYTKDDIGDVTTDLVGVYTSAKS